MNIENDLIRVNSIERNKKLDKLCEEMSELEEAYEIYVKTGDIKPLLDELIDVVIITLGLAIVKHGLNLCEIMAMFKLKLSINVQIKEMMKRGITYDEARKNIRG